MAQFIKVAHTADLASGSAKCVEVAGKKIALFNLQGSFYAIDDTCPHRGGPLCEGEVAGEEVTCPWHAAPGLTRAGDHEARGTLSCCQASSCVTEYSHGMRRIRETVAGVGCAPEESLH